MDQPSTLLQEAEVCITIISSSFFFAAHWEQLIHIYVAYTILCQSEFCSEWVRAEEDCRTAIQLDSHSVKVGVFTYL